MLGRCNIEHHCTTGVYIYKPQGLFSLDILPFCSQPLVKRCKELAFPCGPDGMDLSPFLWKFVACCTSGNPTRWFLESQMLSAEMDGMTRLVDGSAGPGFEYGRLEIFARGFWSNVCNKDRFTPDAALVACKALGYGGGAALRFTQSYATSLSPVCTLSCVTQCMFCFVGVLMCAVSMHHVQACNLK